MYVFISALVSGMIEFKNILEIQVNVVVVVVKAIKVF